MIGGSSTSVRFCPAPTSDSPKPWRSGGSIRGTRDSAAGSVHAIPIPWSARATTNGRSDAPGLDARQQQDPARDEVGEAAEVEQADAAEGVDEAAAHDRGGDLDEGRHADDEPDGRVRDAAAGECERQRGGEAVEPGLDQEHGQRQAEDVQRGLVGRGGWRPRRRTDLPGLSGIVPAGSRDTPGVPAPPESTHGSCASGLGRRPIGVQALSAARSRKPWQDRAMHEEIQDRDEGHGRDERPANPEDGESAYEPPPAGPCAPRAPPQRPGGRGPRACRAPRARQGLDPRGARARLLQLRPGRARRARRSRRCSTSTRRRTTPTTPSGRASSGWAATARPGRISAWRSRWRRRRACTAPRSNGCRTRDATRRTSRRRPSLQGRAHEPTRRAGTVRVGASSSPIA